MLLRIINANTEMLSAVNITPLAIRYITALLTQPMSLHQKSECPMIVTC